jgi:ssDNA-binding Zn-finger/Zn-ribbon topoisomerase 1
MNTSGSATEIPTPACPECHGKTVLFRGSGHNVQYYICSRGKEPGHLTWEEVQAEIARVRSAAMPSGRWA